MAHQNISLELLTRGFSTFQSYFDAVRVLRSIFRLAAATQPAGAIQNPMRSLARQAILSVASVNAPLFLTVLSFDAMQAQADPEERAATMKLIAFMVRKVSGNHKISESQMLKFEICISRNLSCYSPASQDLRKLSYGLWTREVVLEVPYNRRPHSYSSKLL